ncbi:hypothetical protein [Chryseobacterium culicis]|uniref:Uncharacterized protein n=1 Tax=Chryseobacterium culicis TaxID=680127 RepID=A0A1H6HAI6_CHRCI|nr:hypothetical protein [Chryseobacterium culicis]SEH32811.1 hypothetical protein SAMN05421593_1965 [Chryseobacterium culicis]
MKFIIPTLLIGIIVLSCKKEPKTEEPLATDSITADTMAADTVSSVTPLPSDTLRTDTVSSKNNMDTVNSPKNKTIQK